MAIRSNNTKKETILIFMLHKVCKSNNLVILKKKAITIMVINVTNKKDNGNKIKRSAKAVINNYDSV